MSDNEPRRRRGRLPNDEGRGQAVTIQDAELPPGACHFEAIEPYQRMVGLHIARAHAAVERAERDLHLRLAAGPLSRSDPLAIAADESTMTAINALEGAGISTVGDLLDLFTPEGYAVPPITQCGPVSIASVLAAVLKGVVGDGD